mmetsp:Transcript_11383/g.17384  ORF Transcript_11383/g.17384 Transcript_11383/m.17384 type:complete len:153 (+) Transcript_11383:227-685(+)
MQPFWARPSALQGSGQAMIDEYESQLSSPSSSPTNLPFFKKNKMDGTLRQLTCKKRKALQATQSDLLKLCTKPRPRLPTQESTSTLCAIFLSHLDCTSLEPDALKCVDDASNLFFSPSTPTTTMQCSSSSFVRCNSQRLTYELNALSMAMFL